MAPVGPKPTVAKAVSKGSDMLLTQKAAAVHLPSEVNTTIGILLSLMYALAFLGLLLGYNVSSAVLAVLLSMYSYFWITCPYVGLNDSPVLALEVMYCYSKNEKAQIQALDNLFFNLNTKPNKEETIMRLYEKGVLDAVCDSVHEFKRSNEVVARCLGVFAKMSGNSKVKLELSARLSSEWCTSTIENHIQDKRVCKYGLLLYSNLTEENTFDVKLEEESVLMERIGQAMHIHEDDAEVQLWGSVSIFNTCEMLLDSSNSGVNTALQCVLRALIIHQGSESIHCIGLAILLKALTVNKATNIEIFKGLASQSFEVSRTNHPDMPKIQGLLRLINLKLSCSNYQES